MGDVLYSIGVSGFIYPIFGHWCWGPDGFLATMGSEGHFLSSLGMNFHDFAGSTVVHSIGGWVAIAGAIMLGPRLGRKFKRDGGGPMLPHDLTIAVIGGLILWFGWYGFNPCSTLSIMDNAGVGRVATNTTLAACTGGLAAIFVMFFRTKKWDTTAIINGFLAGLVGDHLPLLLGQRRWRLRHRRGGGRAGHPGDGIARASPHRRPGRRLARSRRVRHLGHAVAGPLRQRPVLRRPVRARSGFPRSFPDSPEALTGLFYGGGMKVLEAQCIGSVIICTATFASAMAMFAALNAVGLLRVSKEGEIEGLDIDQHGISAYPEAEISGGVPTGSHSHGTRPAAGAMAPEMG